MKKLLIILPIISMLFSATLEVNYSSDTDIYGFQFNVNGTGVTAGDGGAAADAGFTVSANGGSTVLGFSLLGGFIPAGAGLLTTLTVDDSSGACVEDFTLSAIGGVTLCSPQSEECQIVDCSGVQYPAGGGGDDCTSGIYDCAGDCDGAAVEDCNGDCGGSAVVDDCGECGGDGSTCATTTVDVLYDFDIDIAGFQFNVDGAEVVGASGGAAGSAGFTLSSSATTVIGFSMSGAVVSAGTGTLVTLEVSGDSACLSGLVLTGIGGDEGSGSEIIDCLTVATIADDCVYDCAGVCDGTAVEDCNGDCDGIAVEDCAGTCNGSAVEDCAGVCGGDAVDLGCGCGEAGPSGCDNVCGSTAVEDCNGDCGGSAVEDECGVCGGSGIADGACDCDGNVLDCTGVCGGIEDCLADNWYEYGEGGYVLSSGNTVPWNAASYQNTNSVTYAVQLDGEMVGDEGDLLGAFYDGDLRGIADTFEVTFGDNVGENFF